jgi:hypothetical protein
MHYSYSSTLKGCGVFAGGPFICAMGNAAAAVTYCMSEPSYINVSFLEETIAGLVLGSQIDDTTNIKGS